MIYWKKAFIETTESGLGKVQNVQSYTFDNYTVLRSVRDLNPGMKAVVNKLLIHIFAVIHAMPRPGKKVIIKCAR